MNCPFCLQPCHEKDITAGYFSYMCSQVVIAPNIIFHVFKCNTKKESILFFSCKKLLKANHEFSSDLEITYSYKPPQANIYINTSYSDNDKYKPPHRLKVIDGIMTPEQAVELLTHYSKLMAFL